MASAGGGASYADAVVGNRDPDVGFKLTDFPDLRAAHHIELGREIWEKGEKMWENTLVGKVLGLRPSIEKIKGYVRGRWGKIPGKSETAEIRVSAVRNGFFLFSFESSEMMARVLSKGIWTFDNRPLVVRKWNPKSPIEELLGQDIPVWVTLPNLDPRLWSAEALSMLSSVLGKPVCSDGVTAQLGKLTYARVCVEVSPEFEPPKRISFPGPDGSIWTQEVQFEWLPNRCGHCKTFDHGEGWCPNHPKDTNWKRKPHLKNQFVRGRPPRPVRPHVETPVVPAEPEETSATIGEVVGDSDADVVVPRDGFVAEAADAGITAAVSKADSPAQVATTVDVAADLAQSVVNLEPISIPAANVELDACKRAEGHEYTITISTDENCNLTIIHPEELQGWGMKKRRQKMSRVVRASLSKDGFFNKEGIPKSPNLNFTTVVRDSSGGNVREGIPPIHMVAYDD